MGADFVQRVDKTLKRSWDKGRAAIAAPDLTTRELVSGGRSVAADIVRGATLSQGEHLTVQLEGGALVARRCLTVVARNDNPSSAVVGVLNQYCNIRPGTVSQVHDMAGMVEITITC
jgi:hypothetical protein